MKFVISSSILSARLQQAGRVVGTKNTMPLAECFLFDIADNRLHITATETDMTLSTSVDLVESDGNIRFAVNAKTLQDALKEIPEQPLEFYVNDALVITIEYQNGKYNLTGQPADDFPLPKEEEGETQTLALDAQMFLRGLSRALFATADDTLRPVMNGVFIDATQGSDLSIVASDGHKLACSTLTGATTSAPASFILPKKPAGVIKNVFAREEGEISITFGERLAVFRTENFCLHCCLIEGRYPNYNSVIPQDNPNCVTINRAALISAIRRVIVFANASSALVKLRIETSKITIQTQDIDFSMSAEEAILCDYSGVPLTIGFKGPFLMDLLSNMESEEVIIRLNDSSRAGVIVPANEAEGERILMLIMPMMVSE